MDINSYGNAIDRVVSATFAPDIASPGAPRSEPLADDGSVTGVSSTGSFKDTVKGFLNEVNDKMVAADTNSQALATGRSNDLEGTVKSVEEAGLAMQFTLAIRNKLLESYQEISRMQV